MNPIRVGITGVAGFIGRHLLHRLKRDERFSVTGIDKEAFMNASRLHDFVGQCDVIVHLAAMNRGELDEIYRVNTELVERLTLAMKARSVRPYVIFASSVQKDHDHPYGLSKRKGQDGLSQWARGHEGTVTTLIIPNVFGDGCKPFYNSVVSTFCYQMTHGEQPRIIDDKEMELIHINELTESFLKTIEEPPTGAQEIRVEGTTTITVTQLRNILEDFRQTYFEQKTVPALSSPFVKQLYAVFLSYIPYDKLRLTPVIHSDARGSLFEIIRLTQGGQIFFSITKPGQTRGNHYHTKKIERFCVLQGQGVIRLRKLGTNDIIEYLISREQPSFVEIPVFHAHNIENTGHDDLLTLFWSNELFDPEDSDTFVEKV
jgi:UDP-2-acetamido-2,6-beta-L-arabino-hexul-4-ose reductase